MSRWLATALVLALGCGPGLDEGAPDSGVADSSTDTGASDGSNPDGGADAADDAAVTDGPRPDAWRCVEHQASTYEHVKQGRAYLCGAEACAYGSDQKLGLYNVANIVVLRQVARDRFERGRCP